MLVTLRKIAAVGLIAFLAVLGGTAAASASNGDPIIKLRNTATGRCIDDSDFGFRTNTCNSSSYQTWSIGLNGNGGFPFILLNSATLRCVDDSDFGFRTNTCNFLDHQTFNYTP